MHARGTVVILQYYCILRCLSNRGETWTVLCDQWVYRAAWEASPNPQVFGIWIDSQNMLVLSLKNVSPFSPYEARAVFMASSDAFSVSFSGGTPERLDSTTGAAIRKPKTSKMQRKVTAEASKQRDRSFCCSCRLLAGC